MLNNIKVKKRNGSEEKLDTAKIESMCKFGYELSDLPYTELLQKLDIAFYDGMETKDIQNIIVYESKLFIVESNNNNYKYAVISGRLEMAALHSEIHKNTNGLDQKDFLAGYKMLVSRGYYKLTDVSDKILQLLEKYIDTEVDFTLPTQSVVSLKNMYLLKDVNGNHIEYNQWHNMADAMVYASKHYTNVEENVENYVKDCINFYNLLKSRIIVESTPVNKNLRIGGNTASCFSMVVEDNIENIFDRIKEAALVSKEGGGLAVYVGKIRPDGSSIRGVHGVAANINKWVKFFDVVAGTVDQLGSRKGAISVANDWFHLDFMEFMEVGSEDGGDIRTKSFDIIPQFLINNYLLEQVKSKKDVYLVNNHDCIKNLNIDLTELVGDDWKNAYNTVVSNLDKVAHKKVNAYKLWTTMWDIYFKVGKINIANKDGLNSNNYLRKHYLAQTGNLCLESFSINSTEFDHTCNLLSINLTELAKYEKQFNSKLKIAVRAAVDMLNTIIDISKYPTDRTEKSAKHLRNVGICLLGGADYLAYNKIPYNKKGIKELERVQELIAFYAYERSIELAEKYGPYKLFDKADYSIMFNKTPEELTEASLNNLDWVSLHSRLTSSGVRNFLLLSPAPNTGTGVVTGASPNFLPVTSLCHYKDMQKMTPIIVPAFSDERFSYYRTRGTYDGVFFLEAAAAIQKWTDTGVSNEIGVNPDLFEMIPFSDKVIELMLKNELKAVYYMSETACESCAN